METSIIKTAVRRILDYNEVTQPIAGLDDSVLSVDDIIEGNIEGAAVMTIQMLPKEYIVWSDLLAEDDDESEEGTTEDDDKDEKPTALSVDIPSDYIRFGSAYSASWYKPVTKLYTDVDEEYQKVFSEFAGVAPNASRPAGYIAGDKIFFRPYADDIEATYAAKPSIESNEIELGIADSMLPAYYHVLAALTCETLKDTDKSNQMMQIAKNMMTSADNVQQ